MECAGCDTSGCKRRRASGCKWRQPGIKWQQPGGKWRQPDGMVAASEWNSYTPCILDFLMAKDFKASALHVSELSIALPWIPNNSPPSQIALVIKKLSKHQNLTQFD